MTSTVEVSIDPDWSFTDTEWQTKIQDELSKFIGIINRPGLSERTQDAVWMIQTEAFRRGEFVYTGDPYKWKTEECQESLRKLAKELCPDEDFSGFDYPLGYFSSNDPDFHRKIR